MPADTITVNLTSNPTTLNVNLSTYTDSLSVSLVETTLTFLQGAGLYRANVFTQTNTFLQDLSVGGAITSVNSIQIDTAATTTAGIGKLIWDDTDGTLSLGLKGGVVSSQLGQGLVTRVVNKTVPSIDLVGSNYPVVVVTGAQGQRLAIKLAQGNNDLNSAGTLGIVAENISKNQEGFVITVGLLKNINTTGNLQGESWADGDILYLSPFTPGVITNIKPLAPNHTVIVGYVEYAHQNNGKIYVKIDNGYELGELHNVLTNGVTDGQVLTYFSALSVWSHKTIPTPNLSAYLPLSGGTVTGALTVNGTLSAKTYAGIPTPDLSQYLPLSGGTLTGGLTGTSLTISNSISAKSTIYTAGNPVVSSPTIVNIISVTSSQYSALVSAGTALSSNLYLVQDP